MMSKGAQQGSLSLILYNYTQHTTHGANQLVSWGAPPLLLSFETHTPYYRLLLLLKFQNITQGANHDERGALRSDNENLIGLRSLRYLSAWYSDRNRALGQSYRGRKKRGKEKEPHRSCSPCDRTDHRRRTPPSIPSGDIHVGSK